MINMGIMQSRLSPVDLNKGYQYWPEMWWDNEFKLAKLYGFSHIEWIYDDNPNNLLNTDEGVKEILSVVKNNGVEVKCICADYFIKHPFWDMNKDNRINNIKVLNTLITQGFKLGVRNITIPLIEESTLQGGIGESRKKSFQMNIQPCLDIAGRYMINICLETDLKPYLELNPLIAECKSERMGICHDTGNLEGDGYDAVESFSVSYPFVKHIHLKDKVKRQKENVEITRGDVNFSGLFKLMKDVKYDGTVTLQCSRKEYDLDFIKRQFKKVRELENAR